ncbi:hypothetical protein SSX86_007561 [Deinandra increscens subsp. villosa]|uniref:Activating signal cointegrator 1 n=1 Tax=Deinandra increscens subsp. villosa TaxID=3103831 RepID=A0AAP0DIA4_9ASTR
METAGQWLEKALLDLCRKTEGLDLDGDLISGLVSYCDLAPPLDAKEYLDNIVGEEAGRHVIGEYLKRRGYIDTTTGTSLDGQTSKFREYVKPPAEEPINVTKKPVRPPKEAAQSSSKEKNTPNQIIPSQNQPTTNQSKSKKKKSGKVVSLAEASKGSIIFQKGKPCSCEARRHRLVSNCLSCGKIVCEQEGEGPCSFCGALVLREGSTYAGLEDEVGPLSDAEAAAEAYAKRLVDYDRNSAARTTVIDDQSDYYEMEGNTWLSMEEKELLRKKKEEIEEAERANRNKVVISFDLVGRKVLLNEDEASDELHSSILLKPANADAREVNRIKPNPTLEIQPIFIDPGHSKKKSDMRKGNIVGEEAGRHVIGEYLKRRGYIDTTTGTSLDGQTSKFREYVKPPAEEPINVTKKPVRPPKEAAQSSSKEKNTPNQIIPSQNQPTTNQSKSKKKKSGKVVSLAEASKGSIIFQKGKPCSCEARRHRLVSNCLSCGKIVCEQEGEGPCSFCGALVLREGSTYAGLEDEVGPLSDAEAAAEAYAKRLVDYDRNSAARTTVIDDQSDYYEMEGNTWLSMEEKELLRKKKEEIEEAERANRNKVVISFDLVGRKVLLNEDEASDELHSSILLKPANADAREVNRIKPNPTLEIQPIFIDPGHSKKNSDMRKGISTGLCLEISGRVQHDKSELKHHDHLDISSF